MISIVIAVLNSPEVVRRQVLHFKRMPLPNDVEIVIVDDKSTPPLDPEKYDLPRLRILRYEEHQCAWSQPAARNHGAKNAVGEWLICTDIDHIVTLDLINFVRDSNYDFIKFKREVAILNAAGIFEQTPEAVLAYGFEEKRLGPGRNNYHICPHTNSFAVKRDLFLRLGGVSERYMGTGRHPNREEIPLRRQLRREARSGRAKMLDAHTDGQDLRPTLYMIPNGQYCGHKDFNPFGLFHTTPRKTTVQWQPSV